mmetsp:Transcript_8078/g.20733  ORF Transcript_8078/g.20733 Transcript_8078/m.20733 type:complete len:100 (-) Transcript_8078:1876-2175(-)
MFDAINSFCSLSSSSFFLLKKKNLFIFYPVGKKDGEVAVGGDGRADALAADSHDGGVLVTACRGTSEMEFRVYTLPRQMKRKREEKKQIRRSQSLRVFC